MTELDQTTPATDESEQEQAAEAVAATVAMIVARVHDTFRIASDGWPPSGAALRKAADADISSISTHLAALDVYVLPVLRRHLRGQDDELRGLESTARSAERHLRHLQEVLRGNTHQSRAPFSELQGELARLVDDLIERERVLADAVDQTLSASEAARMVKHLRAAALDGPTRPHPHLGHLPGLRRAGYHLAKLVDHALDAMETRTVTPPTALLADEAEREEPADQPAAQQPVAAAA